MRKFSRRELRAVRCIVNSARMAFTPCVSFEDPWLPLALLMNLLGLRVSS
jgi:hypothetical protein